VKGFVRILDPSTNTTTVHILNWAFSRFELTPFPNLDDSEDLEGVSFRFTVMGARGEVMRRARKLAEVLGGQVA
jgi:hypothetical protein